MVNDPDASSSSSPATCSIAAYGKGGTDDSLIFGFGGVHGPGSYSSSTFTGYEPTYQWAQCSTAGGTCAMVETFGGPAASAGCTVDVTVAPAHDEVGAPIAGTFSCPHLVDAADPTRIVSVTGSFSALIHVPPD